MDKLTQRNSAEQNGNESEWGHPGGWTRTASIIFQPTRMNNGLSDTKTPNALQTFYERNSFRFRNNDIFIK